MNARFLVDLYNWSNPATGYIAMVNIGWIVIVIIMALVQHKDLNKWVANDPNHQPDNWQIPLVIIFVLACSALAVYFTPYWLPGGLGWSTFIIPVACYGAELFFTNDYRKTLSKHVWKTWYWRIVMWGEWLVAINFVFATVFMVLSRIVTNY